MPGPIATKAAHGPVTLTAALLSANTIASTQGVLDAERAARVRVEYLDTWANRWGQDIPAGKNYA